MHTIADLATMTKRQVTRWASPENWSAGKGTACAGDDGRKRSPCFTLKAGERRVLAEATGSGCIRRIWMTVNRRSPQMLRGVRIEIFWDGAATPAVSAPLGDFFGHMLGRMATFQNALFASPEGRSFVCYAPMPFRTGMRVLLINDNAEDLENVYFDVDFTLGDELGSDTLYFHAHWRREHPTVPRSDFALLPRLQGRGRFLGVTIGVAADTEAWLKTWWGEGEVKVYLDGDGDHPTLCGTGTEDYIGTGWGQGQYANLYQGCHLADAERLQYGFYRLHVPDPIWFHRDIRVTIQQIGCWDPSNIRQLHEKGIVLEHGTERIDTAAKAEECRFGLFERHDDWSSCAYFYLDRAENGLPALVSVAERVRGLASA